MELPLFPLNTVLFPDGLLPLKIFEQRYMDMAKGCLRDGSAFGVCAIREGHEVGAPAVPARVGCFARIIEWDMPQLGVLQVVARGERRFRIRSRRVQADGLARAAVDFLPEETDAPLDAADICTRVLQRIMEAAPAGLVEAPPRYGSSAWVSARLAELLPLSTAAKQRLLEMDDAPARVEVLRRLISSSGK